MAAVLDVTPESAWTALWRRLQQDRVGAVSLGIVAAYLVMILFAGAGFLAGGWSREVGVPYANPAFIGERPNLEGALRKRAEHKGVAPDLSAVDPLARKYAAGERRTGELKMSEPERSMTRPTRRPLGARCARQGDQGLAGLDRGRRVGRALRHRHRHPAWRLRRF